MSRPAQSSSSQPMQRRWLREYGRSLDPEVLATSAYALVVGLAAGLIARKCAYRRCSNIRSQALTGVQRA